MAFSRYKGDTRILGGTQLSTADAVVLIRQSIKSGKLPIVNQLITNGDDRLDSLAGSIYGDARYWWVLAAASGIGWGLQVPPGTLIKIPDLAEVMRLS